MLVIPYQQRSAFAQPTQCPLDHPTPGFVPLGPVARLVFLADLPDVGGMSPRCRRLPSRGVVVALVQAQVLWSFRSRLGAVDYHGFNRRLQEFAVRNVGPVYEPSQRATLLLDQQAGLGAGFGTIRGVFAHLFSPEARFAHAAVGTLPFPVNVAEFVTLGDENRPNLLHHSVAVPALEPAVDRGVIAKLLGHVVPLATTAEAMDNAIEN